MLRLPRALALLLIAGLLVASAAAQGTGTLAGTVVDELGDPLPGANVQLGGTQLGAATDFDGTYRILGVPVGSYDVTASFVGYQAVTATGVVIRSGHTQEVDFELSEGQQLSEIVVAYERPLSERSSIGVPKVLRGDDAENLPIRGVADLAALQGSVVGPDDDLFIRGGRSAEVAYYVDGVQVSPGEAQASARRGREVRAVELSREGYAATVENAFRRPEQHPFSTFGVDVDRAGYANVRRFLNEGRLPVPGAVRLEEMVNYFAYDLPQPHAEHRAPFSLTTEVAACPWQPGHRLVRVALQGRDVDAGQVPPSALVFLLDTSGSMDSPDKLGLLVAGMKLLAQQLRPEDTVAIVTYAGSAGLVLPPTPGTAEGKVAIAEALGRLRAGGSTAGGAGIELAYDVAAQLHRPGVNARVVLATDGDFNVGASSNAEMLALIEEKRETGVFLSVLGLGTGNLQDEKMELLADRGNGQYNYLDSIDEARRVLVSEMAGTLFAIAKDVKIRVEFNPAKVAAYRLLGYENRLLAAEDFEDDRKDAGEIGAGHAVTALYEMVPTGAESPAIAGLPAAVRPRYQQVAPGVGGGDELLTLEMKWKAPDARRSEPALVTALPDRVVPMEQASADFRFASAVAELALLLRESDHRADAQYARLIERARAARGPDADGYRAEFVRLAEAAAALAGEPLVQR